MLKIAITGNIASGKTQAEKFLSDKGFLVFDADKIAHSCLENIKDFYGYDVFSDGKIDRKKLGKLVFDNAELKQNLEQIIHPLVKEEILKIFELNKNEEVIFVSVPLLFEAKFETLFDKIILITTDEKLRLERLMKRNNLSEEEALQRISSQISEKEKISKSDYIIENNSTLKKLENNIENVLMTLF